MVDLKQYFNFSILEQLPVGIFITDTELNVIFWNKRLQLWTSIDEKDVIGKNITDLYPNLKQNTYQVRINDVINGSPAVIFSSQLRPYFIPIELSDGSYRTQTTTLSRHYDDKIGYHLIFTIQDITETQRHLKKIKDLRQKALDEISFREQIQNELKENREMLASINRNITEGLFRIMPGIGITYANNALAQLLGFEDTSALMGTNPLNTLIVSENRDEIIKSLYSGIRNMNGEVRIKRNDGTSFWAQLSASTFLNESNSIQYIDCLISDISIRKEQLHRIQSSEEQYRNLFQNSLVGMYRIRFQDGAILNANKKGLEIFGFNTLDDIRNHNPYREKNDWFKLKDLLQKRFVLDELELRLRRRDDSLFWASIAAKYYPSEGYFEGVILDIEERKQAEILQDALYRVAESSNTQRDINAFFKQIHGIISELMFAENIYIAEYNENPNLIHFSYLEDKFDKFALPKHPSNGITEYILRSGEPMLVSDTDITNMIESGTIEQIGSISKQYLGVPLKSIDKVIGVIAVQSYEQRDIYTERDLEALSFIAQHITASLKRKNYENSLLEAKDIAETASKSKSQFLANVSHDLRTPLNSIIGFTRRVIKKSEQNLDELSLKGLDTVLRNANNLLKLINDVLDTSKIEAGKISYNISQTNINELIYTILEVVEPLATSKQINLEFIETIPFFGKTDPMRLRQVLINIIANAIKFTDQGSVTIVLEQVLYIGSYFIKISVTDTGIGIPEDKTQLIFEVFEQVDSGDEQTRGGTGLGLAISKKMITEMGGDIQVISQLNKGSTFNIFVPTYIKLSK